jgi:hypothetical protein
MGSRRRRTLMALRAREKSSSTSTVSASTRTATAPSLLLPQCRSTASKHLQIPLVPVALSIHKLILAPSAEPKRFFFRNLDDVEPGISRHFVGEVEDDVYFLERTVCGFGVEKVDKWDDGEVCTGKDYVGAVADVVEGDGRYDYNTGEVSFAIQERR